MYFGRSSKDTHASSPATLDWELESPPMVMYGSPESSSGALLSGQLFLDIKEEGLEIESLNATLSIHVTHKKPVVSHCVECANHYTELQRWQLLQQPLAMTRGKHLGPASPRVSGTSSLRSLSAAGRHALTAEWQANTRFRSRCSLKGTSRLAWTRPWFPSRTS